MSSRIPPAVLRKKSDRHVLEHCRMQLRPDPGPLLSGAKAELCSNGFGSCRVGMKKKIALSQKELVSGTLHSINPGGKTLDDRSALNSADHKCRPGIGPGQKIPVRRRNIMAQHMNCTDPSLSSHSVYRDVHLTQPGFDNGGKGSKDKNRSVSASFLRKTDRVQHFLSRTLSKTLQTGQFQSGEYPVRNRDFSGL